MGKPKKSEPDPEPNKIIRVLGKNLSIELSEEEKRYRNKNGPDDVSQVSKDKVKCTVCGKSLADLLKKKTEPYVHMLLNVLMCKECSSFYGDGYFSVDEDGDDKYCRWCGQGGTLYLCSSCTCAFCKKCIKLNLNRHDVKDMESDDWKCFICKPKPLFECRTVCWFLQETAMKKKEESDEVESERGKRRSSLKTEENRGSKRKLSDEPVDRRSKRRKSEDSRHEYKYKKISEEPKDKSMKTTSKTDRTTKRKSSQLENVTTDTFSNSTSTKSNKVEEILISDDDEKEDGDKDEDNTTESPPKRSKNKTSQKEISKKSSKKDVKEVTKHSKKSPSPEREKRSKRSTRDKKKEEIKSPETPKRSSRQVSKTSLEKNKAENKQEKNVTPVKRSQRSSKRNMSYQEESNEESKNSDSESHLISLDDGNSDSEPDNKRKTAKKNEIKLKQKMPKSRISLSKSADTTVIQATGYMNSAIKDVLELTVLISSRCERLCGCIVQSDDDLVNVLKKFKQLMVGVHTNLELIEKGLDTKIGEWRGEKTIDNKSGNVAESETKCPEGDEVKVEDSSSDSKKVQEDKNVVVESKDNLNKSEEMEVDDFEDKSAAKEENDVEGDQQSESMDIVNESQDDSIETADVAEVECKGTSNIEAIEGNGNLVVDESNKHSEKTEEKYTNSEVEGSIKSSEAELSNKNIKEEKTENNADLKVGESKTNVEADESIRNSDEEVLTNASVEEDNKLKSDEIQVITPNESFNKENDDDNDSDIVTKSDAIDEDNNCGHLTEDSESEPVSQHISNEDCKIQENLRLNESGHHIEEGQNSNEDSNGDTENGKIESSESDKSDANKDKKEQDFQRITVEGKISQTSLDEEGDSINKEISNCTLEDEEKSNCSDPTTKQLDNDNSNNPLENGSLSSDCKNVEESESTTLTDTNVEKIIDDKEEEKHSSQLSISDSLSKAEKKIEENALESSSKKCDEKRGTPESKNLKAEEIEKGPNKEHSSSVPKSVEKKDINVLSKTDESKKSPHQQSDRDFSRSSGDKERDYRRPGWESRGGRGHNWGRDSYPQDRWSGGRGGSWNRYDDRRPNRGNWGWTR